jgi:hippurate hydrolase
MKTARLLMACSLLALAGAAGAEDLKAAIDKDYPSLDSLYKTLHAHPELSTKEVETSKRLAKEARDAGFEVTDHVGGTGVVAVLKNGPGPTVLIRTDMDALPVEEATGLPYASTVKAKNARGEDIGVMHACGHDIHMTVWTGVARRMAAEKDKWSGTLVMIGQPAEETIAGAEAMLKDGLFTRFPRPDFNLAIHDTNGLPVVALQTLVSRNANPFDPAVVTVGSIHGGTKHNIIGGSVHLQLSVRSYKEETRKMLLDGIKRIAVNEGRAFGLPEDKLPEVTYSDENTPATYNDPALVGRLVAPLEAALGKDNVIKTDPIMASEDFSRYGLVDPKIPSAILWVGGVEAKKWAATADKNTIPSLHSAHWAPDPEPTIKTGIVTLVTAAQDLLKK